MFIDLGITNLSEEIWDGQLVKDDERLLERGEDGVPSISKLTLSEKLNAVAGDDVVMFPQYSMMQKATISLGGYKSL